MRYHFFLHYGWFFQNLRKEAVRTFMHTTVAAVQRIKRNRHFIFYLTIFVIWKANRSIIVAPIKETSFINSEVIVTLFLKQFSCKICPTSNLTCENDILIAFTWFFESILLEKFIFWHLESLFNFGDRNVVRSWYFSISIKLPFCSDIYYHHGNC